MKRKKHFVVFSPRIFLRPSRTTKRTTKRDHHINFKIVSYLLYKKCHNSVGVTSALDFRLNKIRKATWNSSEIDTLALSHVHLVLLACANRYVLKRKWTTWKLNQKIIRIFRTMMSWHNHKNIPPALTQEAYYNCPGPVWWWRGKDLQKGPGLEVPSTPSPLVNRHTSVRTVPFTSYYVRGR